MEGMDTFEEGEEEEEAIREYGKIYAQTSWHNTEKSHIGLALLGVYLPVLHS